jgi:branched chain amino acid efflux pump
MPDTAHVAAVVAVSAGITWALRAAPFAVLARLRDNTTVEYLSTHMPLGIMVMLAVYTLHGVDLGRAASVVPFAAALPVTIAIHLWRRNALLSILSGTIVHVALATTLTGS